MNEEYNAMMHTARLIELNTLAQSSDDPSRKVACCVVDVKTNKVLAREYNHIPFYIKIDETVDKVVKSNIATHAERACLDTIHECVFHDTVYNRSVDVKVVDVYTTALPCITCATLFAMNSLPIKIRHFICVDNCSDTFKARHSTNEAIALLQNHCERVFVYKGGD